MKEIQLTQGFVALVDDKDFEQLSLHKWHAQKGTRTHYAARKIKVGGKQSVVYMHRQLLQAVDEVDHVDHNGLNNQRVNLRHCTRTENTRNHRKRVDNTSGVTGVGFCKFYKKWKAWIGVNRKCKTLGYFPTMHDAFSARKAAERKFFGKFAPAPLYA